MIRKLPRPALIFLITVICVIVDQATKFIARAYLAPNALFSFGGDIFRLEYAENSGAFLSLGASLPDPWRNLVFTLLVGVFLFGLLGYLLFSRALPAMAVTCLSFVFAGGISNLIDRIAYDGRVVDFLNVGIGSLRTGIFNIADMAITFGALILALDTYLGKDPSDRPNQ